MTLRRLPLRGIHNLRDLGGYPAGFEKATKWKTFFRADGLFELGDDDVERVLSYCKMQTVIDLRGTREVSERPNDFANIDGVKYESIPLIPEDKSLKEIEEEWKTLEAGYIAIAKRGKREIKRIFDIVADAMPNPVLYHCTAGKDRTGIISCLILGACGVDRFDIVSDYEVSLTYISRDLVKMTDPGRQINMEYLVSPPEIMVNFIEYLESEHGSISEFLLDCGIEATKIEKIKSNFLIDINV